MRIRNIKSAKDIIDSSNIMIKDYLNHKGSYKEFFGNDNSIELEIGMGKGSFLLQKALNNPNINYIGIEKYSSIIARAIQKIENYNLNNIKIINCDAKDIDKIFYKEIDKIYLNFSDPWPKKRHARRRLTSEEFLKLYDNIFRKEKVIELKSDSDVLFESSIISLTNYGYAIEDISLDLNNKDMINYKTEYEIKFIEKGIKIKYLKALK